MGQEYILHPQLFESHVSFLSSNSMTAKNINTTTVLASALSAEYIQGQNFGSGSTAVSATFTGVYYGWGWELQGVDKGQPGVNTWVRSNSSIATGFTTLSAKSVYGDFLGTTRFRAQSANVITTNTALGSSTFHGVYYGDGWNLQGIDRGQPGINAWVRANSSNAVGFNTLSAKNIYGDFIGSQSYKNINPGVINTNTLQGSATFHGVFYGDGRNLLGVSFDQPEINAWVRANSAVETLGSFWVEASAGNINNISNWGSIAYGNGKFVSVNYSLTSDNIAISQDSKNWTTITSPVSSLTDIVYGNGLFVAISDANSTLPNKQVVTSTDGKNWISSTCASHNWYKTAYGNGVFVIISNDGYIFYSKDGITWETNPLNVTFNWTAIGYGNDSFIVAANDGFGFCLYAISVDGITWTVNSFASTHDVSNITYGNGVFVMTMSDLTDEYYTSKNGVDWTLRTLPTSLSNTKCAYGDGLFVLTGLKSTTGSILYISKDGVSWTEKLQTGSSSFYSIGYGNGIFVIGSTDKFYVSGYTRTPNEPITNIRHGNNILYGNQTITGTLSVANLSANSSSVSFVVENGGELQKRFLNYSIIPQYTFTKDLSVSLGGGKTFGRYINGDVIASVGKTIPQVFEMALIEPITPDATLTTSTTIAFNQTAISNVLTFTHKISSLGATVASAVLEWRRNNAGSWTSLSTSTASTGTFTHTTTDTAYNTQPFNYRYTVTDTAGATRTVTRDITPASYAQPTISLTVNGTVTSPETNSSRERGNVSSTISGTITRQSSNVALLSYQLQYQVNGTGSWNNVGSSVSVTNGATAAIVSTAHNPTGDAGANSITYRVQVTDAFNTTTATSTSTITFGYYIFYGPSATIPLNSGDVRALPNRQFTSALANPFTFSTGTTLTKFTVALPTALAAHDTVTAWTDDDALGANVTNTNTPFTVNDAAGNGSTYNVYVASASVPFTPTAHTFRVTRG